MSRPAQGPRPTGTEAPTLEGLRAQFESRYRIWRAGRCWIANPVDDPDIAPTIMETDLDAFVDQLRNPPPRAGRPLAAHLLDVEEGR